MTFTLVTSKSIGFTMVNMSAKFDQEIYNGLVSILFTSLFPYMSIVTLTFDLKNNRVHPLTMINIFAKFDEEYTKV